MGQKEALAFLKKNNKSIIKAWEDYKKQVGDSDSQLSDVFEKILTNEGPFHIVANFAAHKHVRSEKDHYSIEAMVNNNVIKAKRLLDLLVENPPEHFFCVSTDKAASTGLWGAYSFEILAFSMKI